MKNIKKAYISIIVGLSLLALFISACSSGGSSSSSSTTTSAPVTTSSTTTSAPASPTSTSTSAAATTFQALAANGKTVFANSCKGCHGANGEGGAGPALWGSAATLGTYNGTTLYNKNAQDMLSFISNKMPLSAPGSLTHQQYLDVLAYILVQGNQVPASDAFVESQLGSVTLK